MSEDEEELIRHIIRVVLCPKSEAGAELCNIDTSFRRVLPKILITDHSEYDITDLFQETGQECSEAEIGAQEDRGEHLDITNEFQSEPSELLPDSYLAYVSACRNWPDPS